jgi:hypothetical protein
MTFYRFDWVDPLPLGFIKYFPFMGIREDYLRFYPCTFDFDLSRNQLIVCP